MAQVEECESDRNRPITQANIHSRAILRFVKHREVYDGVAKRNPVRLRFGSAAESSLDEPTAPSWPPLIFRFDVASPGAAVCAAVSLKAHDLSSLSIS
ncbi:hypothetical protein PGQ11_014699 [Apiospora arundinis]|uniref:Uncharacterized protein n=1 Tax=Apiospora arundinis TaxID=335852 RepID=A0ABR2HTU3_9PEZI